MGPALYRLGFRLLSERLNQPTLRELMARYAHGPGRHGSEFSPENLTFSHSSCNLHFCLLPRFRRYASELLITDRHNRRDSSLVPEGAAGYYVNMNEWNIQSRAHACQ